MFGFNYKSKWYYLWQPFIIKAIGDLNTLKASVISPQSYTNILQEVYGIYIKVEEENDIIINSFKKYE